MSGWLSNAFLAPAGLWFLALLVPVVLLYILKLRRTEIVIPSTLLWLKSLHDLTANAPFQKLRSNILLFLQLLILALAAFALARPFLESRNVSGSNIALVIDRSASMQAREGEQTRQQIAVDEALAMVDGMAGGDRMMVVSFAESAEVLCELTDDKYRLRRALHSITPSEMRTNLGDVLSLARSIAPESREAVSVVPQLDVVLFSDGNLTDRDEVGARAVHITYRRIGSSTRNAGIVGFSQRRPDDGRGQDQTLVLVRNADSAPIATTLSLYFNDALVAVEEVEVPARETREAVFAHENFGAGVLRAELDHDDDLGIDNRAWLTVRPPAQVRTLLVTDGTSTSGYYIRRALALEPRVELSAIEPAAYSPVSDYDLVIFDNVSPDALPRGTVVLFNGLPPWDDLVATGEIENPPVLDIERDHPAMRFLNPSNVRVAKAAQLTLAGGSRTLLSTRGGPLIADVSREGRQVLVVAFDLADSDWPLRLSFPLFLQNIVSWTPRGAASAASTTPAGEPLTIFPLQEAQTAIVRTPDGRSVDVPLDPVRPVYFADTSQTGVYTVSRGADEERVAVNLLDARETDIAPQESLEFGRGTVLASAGPRVQTREFWPWLMYAALALLLIEWWIYSRRAWA